MRKEKGLMTGKKEPAAKIGGNGYQEVNAKSGDEKHLKITFAVIEKMHYSDFNSGNEAEDFKPSDIIDDALLDFVGFNDGIWFCHIIE